MKRDQPSLRRYPVRNRPASGAEGVREVNLLGGDVNAAREKLDGTTGACRSAASGCLPSTAALTVFSTTSHPIGFTDDIIEIVPRYAGAGRFSCICGTRRFRRVLNLMGRTHTLRWNIKQSSVNCARRGRTSDKAHKLYRPVSRGETTDDFRKNHEAYLRASTLI